MLDNPTSDISPNQSQSAPVLLPVNRDVANRADLAIDHAERLIDEANRAGATCPLSVVIPVYNESGTIEEIVRRVVALPVYKEILIVDDASIDGTWEIVDRLASELPEVSAARHEENRGKGAALRTAFERASGDVIVVQDADLEYDPKDILMLVRPIIAKRCDVVYGSRFLAPLQDSSSWLHRFGNRWFTRLSNLFSGQNLTDVETCYKAFRRSMLNEFTLRQDRFGFEPELTAKISRRGYHIYEMPIAYEGRSYAEGKKIGIKDAFNTLWCIVRYGVAD